MAAHAATRIKTEKDNPTMASAGQIQANQLNAKSSTGPRSTEGKQTSAKNCLRHGLNATEATLFASKRSVEASQ